MMQGACETGEAAAVSEHIQNQPHVVTCTYLQLLMPVVSAATCCIQDESSQSHNHACHDAGMVLHYSQCCEQGRLWQAALRTLTHAMMSHHTCMMLVCVCVTGSV